MTEGIITLIGSLIFIVGGMVYLSIEDKRYWKNYWIDYKKCDEENNARILRDIEEFRKRNLK